ncbi:serine hydrolase [Hyphococcus flavus]|uniref:Serine hydrolase n=1 Tax=Hyphococcus flavus TaxID=1866326 RepID=A0AAE9ZE82_9PROT|nr:serine hydrolase domain-containing protein [Hyphococcus flavus]WDI30932.1 serine hydrolase [Hyphococcus flavus]
MICFKFAAAPLFAAAVSFSAAKASPAQYILDSLREMNDIPGLSSAVSINGEIIWTGQTGYRDVEAALPVTADTQFRLASVSKLFAAAAVLALVEDGKLDPDADIRTYVPDWPAHEGATITLRQLAAHTSGMAHYDASDNYDPQANYSNLNESLSVYSHKPLLFEPGDQYSYSSYGYALMGAALENASGNSFEDYIAGAILAPNRLKNTTVENIHAVPEAASKLYALGSGEIERNNQHHVVGATGILSTPSDLVSFADAYMAGAIVSPELVEMSVTPVKLNNGENAGISRFDMGFGWRISETSDGDLIYHHAGITPGARSILVHNRDQNTSSALVSNVQWTTRIETTGAILATAATEGAQVDMAGCPVGKWSYSGKFVSDRDNPPTEENASGTIRVKRSDDMCLVEVHPEQELASWLKATNAKRDYMPAVLIGSNEEDDKLFAVVTAWGAYPLQWTDVGEKQTLIGDFAGRDVRLELSASQ